MSLENNIQELINAINGLKEVIVSASSAEAPSNEGAAGTSKATAQPTPAAPSPSAAPTGCTASHDDVRNICDELIDARNDGPEQFGKLLAEFGYTRIPELNPSQCAEIIEMAKKLLPQAA